MNTPSLHENGHNVPPATVLGKARRGHRIKIAAERSRDALDVKAQRAIALERSGARHDARLLWMELASSANDRQLGDYKVFRRLAKDAIKRRDEDSAIRFLERHIELRSDDRDASDRLLQLRLIRTNECERRRIYRRHIKRFGETPSTRILRAMLIEAPESRAAAINMLERIEQDAGPSRDLLLRVAQAHEQLDNLTRALTVLDADIVRSSSRAARARLRIMRVLGAGKSESLTLAEQLVASEPNVAAHHVLHGRMLRKFDNPAGAAAAFQKALILEPDAVSSWVGAISANVALERNEQVASLLADARTHFKRRGYRGRVALARIELAAGCHYEAIDTVRHVVSNPSVTAPAREAMALAMVESGQYFQGWGHLAAALRNDTADIPLRRAAVRCAAALRSVENPGIELPRFPDALFVRALLDPPPRPILPATDTVLLATSSLGAGGAERQVALTAAGVSGLRGSRKRTVLVGLDLTPARGRSTMRALAETECLEIVDLAGVNDSHVFRSLAAEDPTLRDVLKLVGAFPAALSRDILKLYACFRSCRPSIVHLWQDGVISSGAVAAVLAGIPKIVCSMRNVVAGDTDRRRYRAYLQNMYMTLAKLPEVSFTANSAAGARDYEAWLGFDVGRIRVLRNGVDVRGIRDRAPPEAQNDVRQRLGFPKGSLIVGGVFRLAPAKRPHLWLEVVSQLAMSDDRVCGVIVGDGVMREELERAIAAKGLQQRIVLAGHQNPVEPWMSVMDVLLLSSKVEGLPNVLLEAESLGVPVVTTEAGGSGEAILDGITGKLVTDDTPEKLAAAIAAVVRSTSIRKRARVGSPVFIEQRFGITRMIAETLDAYGLTTTT